MSNEQPKRVPLTKAEELSLIQRQLDRNPHRGSEVIDGVMSEEEREASWQRSKRRSREAWLKLPQRKRSCGGDLRRA